MLNQQECLAAGIDFEEGVARFVGNADIYEKFLRDFLGDQTFASRTAPCGQATYRPRSRPRTRSRA